MSEQALFHSARARAQCALLCASLFLAACATTGTTPNRGIGAPPAEGTWPVSTKEHVDLWLHGFALVTGDTARIPFFRRGYRERIKSVKGKRNIVTMLDANVDRLSARFRMNPSLVNAQFLPFYFSSFEEIQRAFDLYMRAGGDPRATYDPTMRQYFALFNAMIPAGQDRDWMRLFLESLADENTRFYHDYWSTEQQARLATRHKVDSLWQRSVRPRLQRFLAATQQENGDLMLSLPLDGEGRTVPFAKRSNAVAVCFPDPQSEAAEAVYTFAHEVVQSITTAAINDNTTPAEQRAGVSGRYTANANVRAAAMLLQRATPELAQGFMRYYLRSAGLAVPAGDPTSAFVTAFSIPDAIRDAVARQLDIVLGGI